MVFPITTRMRKVSKMEVRNHPDKQNIRILWYSITLQMNWSKLRFSIKKQARVVFSSQKKEAMKIMTHYVLHMLNKHPP